MVKLTWSQILGALSIFIIALLIDLLTELDTLIKFYITLLLIIVGIIILLYEFVQKLIHNFNENRMRITRIKEDIERIKTKKTPMHVTSGDMVYIRTHLKKFRRIKDLKILFEHEKKGFKKIAKNAKKAIKEQKKREVERYKNL